MSILSQIIAYSPNKIDTETKAKGLLLAEVPRSEMDNFNTPDLDQGADSILRPGETLEDDFDVEFRRPNAQGGMQQLVQPNADGSRPGYSGKSSIDSKLLNSEAVRMTGGKFKTWDSITDKTLRENVRRSAKRREQGASIGKGRPGVKKDYKTISPMKDPKVVEEVIKTRKKTYQASPEGIRLQWIADNSKDYDTPDKLKKAYEKHFKHKVGSKTDALFNIEKKPGTRGGVGSATGKKINFGLVDGLQNFSTSERGNLMFITKGFSEDELFKGAILQNNPKVQTQFKNLFKDIHNNVSLYSELGPEGIVERLRSQGGNLLEDFDFIKSYSSGGQQTYGGVHSGITRNSLFNLGVPEKHLTSYQTVRKPLQSLEQILVDLKNRGASERYGISNSTAFKIASQLDNFLKGQGNLRKDIAAIDKQLGDVKFKQIFGGVNFEHTLAKRFGKDYKYLPRNYLLKGQFTSAAFNQMKKNAFDLPLIDLMKKHEQGKVSGKEVQKFIDDFNAKTNNYADFKFDVDKGKLGYTDTKVSYDLSRYNDPNVARQELIDNIKLTQSDTFQKGMSKTLPDSKDQLKLFRSKQGKKMLALLEKLGCGQAAGGRILFSNGTPGATMTECAFEGKKKLNKGMSVGFDKTEGDLAKKILQAGRGLGSMFALRNLLGPAAMGFTVAAEAGLVGYDMLSSGKSFREAVGASLFNYALGDKTKIDSDEERYKRYESLGYDADKIRNYENTMDRINEIGFQYDDLYSKANAVNIGGPRRSDAVKEKQQIISDRAIEEIPAFSQDLYRTGEIPRLEEFVKNNFVSGAEEIQRADQEALIQQKESGGPKFMGKVFPKFEEGRQQDILNAQGILGYKSPSSTVSNYMSNLSEGGIASLNVKK